MRKFVCVLLIYALIVFPFADAYAGNEISYGNQNDAIADLQEKLKTLGFFSGECTGEFELETQIAIENFQRANGLSVTGEADSDTLRAVESAKAVTKGEYLELAAGGEPFAEDIGPQSARKTVRKLQNLLLSLGYDPGKAEGAYNDETRNAVRLFQWANLLPVTGVADPETMRVMTSEGAVRCDERVTGAVLRYGDQGNDVKLLQNLLNATGYFTGERSGKYGRKTQEAVTLFQRANGLPATGECDVSLLLTLLSGEGVTRAESDRVEATRQVMLGDEADCVRSIKRQLEELGYYHGENSSVFTQELAQAVSYFQDANAIPSTGIADAQTREMLNAGGCVGMEEYAKKMSVCEVRPGDNSYGVVLLQMRLRELGFLTAAITGVYEKATQDAVAQFQRGNLLPETGIADAETRALMNGDRALDAVRAQENYLARSEENRRASLANQVCEAALNCVSKPYEEGRIGPDRFGNAGLTYYCFGAQGVDLPPTAAMQLDFARRNESWSDSPEALSPGRQAFVSANGEPMALIYVGDGVFVFASNARKLVVAEENVQDMEGYEFIGSVWWF